MKILILAILSMYISFIYCITFKLQYTGGEKEKKERKAIQKMTKKEEKNTQKAGQIESTKQVGRNKTKAAIITKSLYRAHSLTVVTLR